MGDAAGAPDAAPEDLSDITDNPAVAALAAWELVWHAAHLSDDRHGDDVFLALGSVGDDLAGVLQDLWALEGVAPDGDYEVIREATAAVLGIEIHDV